MRSGLPSRQTQGAHALAGGTQLSLTSRCACAQEKRRAYASIRAPAQIYSRSTVHGYVITGCGVAQLEDGVALGFDHSVADRAVLDQLLLRLVGR